DLADVSPKPSTEQLDEGFTATAYPKVQENLKLTVEEHVLLEEPASSSGTLSYLQHLSKDISFGDLFFSDKPSEVDNDKANAETEVESIVSVTIQQDMSSIPQMTSPIIDLTSRPKSPKVSKAISEVVTKAVDWAIQAPLRNRFRDLPEADMKEILRQRMWETESYKSHEDHMLLYKALEKRTSTPTGSFRHDEPSYAKLGQSESEESKKVVPGADEGGQGEGQARPDPGAQAEGQTGSEAGAQDEGQDGSNPDENSKGHARLDPGNAGADV
nr:hypothetical protein [Tanacetum cinerariifolium]